MSVKNKISIFLLFTLLLCGACERVIHIEYKGNPSGIVLNGILSPGSGLWLNVSKSVGASKPFDKSYLPVDAARVSIYQGELLLTTITENDAGNYFSQDFIPLEGQDYRIEVQASGLPYARAEVCIPEKVDMKDFDTTVVVRERNTYANNISMAVDFYLQFSLSDPVETTNYYMLGAYYSEFGEYYPVGLDSEDLEMNIYIMDGVDVLAWTDENFNGKDRGFNVSFTLNKNVGFETSIIFTLYSIEKEYYDYLKTYSQNFTVLNSDMIMFEPVLVSSNVTGGYGILAAISSDSGSFNYVFR